MGLRPIVLNRKLLGNPRVKEKDMKRKAFLNTGEFARVCRTTRETILHYDRKGLLVPDHVSENGYRRYRPKQFFDFDIISLLKETGSTLEEIRRYREGCGQEGYLELVTGRIAVLEKEQERFAHRLSMLKKLADLGREALVSEYDRIFFEKRKATRILVYPVDSDKITDLESSVECYSECLMKSLMDGNAIDPPLGVIIPGKYASEGTFRICSIFTAAWGTGLEHSVEVEEGEYACFFHRGGVQSHARAFSRMMKELEDMDFLPCGDVYAYDQMNYVLACGEDEYVARYVVRVKRQSA